MSHVRYADVLLHGVCDIRAQSLNLAAAEEKIVPTPI